ncbi:ATP-binding sensor histidine kinase [Nostoc sp. PCC 7107]|uniref:trifunctional serine/threonine-protein kinase/ATP-binding protein/sensor histidine kinase n=1 Tax=Nostoc sp. PCC 7107 TaxID=317936 RepID=UPI00029F4858|nr:ATP-binding sensor histidine kinase [Nostoc sp. PCC 7107]AFY41078.1 multi-sensor signal transduction multi-kinase [Nostoc sp. PCC 7107]
MLSIPGYRLGKELYNGSKTLVYRAVRESDCSSLIIKLLKNPYPSFSELVQFRNQYTIAKNLNYPEIIQTYSLETYQNGYGLVMEDFGGISLQEWRVGVSGEFLREFLHIAIAMCNCLEILYRERIIHKDIKPSNILINPETKQVKLIDFSIASLLPRETHTVLNPNVIEGTLAYISPEQTGRMNRGIDYRTDFYSLGVTFYELLTGELPFRSDDAMELLHCHIAKVAPLVDKINPQIPAVLSEIINKLMAKNAEDRYQSSLGLKTDLQNCLYQLKSTGEIHSFLIAQRDVCDRFIIPDKLYGRELEVEILLKAFGRVSAGATEMVLVAGFSGIGKTAVVNEVHKPIVRQRGYFIKGKYDQFQRNIPFSAFVQAFRDLMGQLLTESDTQIQQWKTQILDAVGENGQVIIEVIPELARIIGEQPAAVELFGTAAQNRFNLLFQKFTQVFTSPDHPLVIFLDDLQWADSASLNLMQILMADTNYLLLIGAYRDNEVHPGHRLILTLNEIQEKQIPINTITLAALGQETINQLVADTLKCAANLPKNLSQLIYQKTQGNPFFTTQFLKALYQDHLIKFDLDLGCWQCDITQIATQAITDDVVTFMSWQLRKLPQSTQQVLQLAACIGNSFDLATLAIVSQQSEIETAAALWKALQEGLILPINNIYKFYHPVSLVNGDFSSVDELQQTTNDQDQMTVFYKFLHDRVQQAAYCLIPDDQKQATHLQIGQLLQAQVSEYEQEEKLFDIVGHFNQGRGLITQTSDRQTLAQLNFKAGEKAKTATAYSAATIYLQIAIALLEPDCWQTQYELTSNLYVAAAEASYLNGDFDGMEKFAALVLQQAKTILDKVKIYEIQIAAQTSRSQMLAAIAVGREALGQLGVEFPTELDELHLQKALAEVNQQLDGKEIAKLIDLPQMSESTAQAAMELLGMLFAPVFLGNPSLLPLLGATMVRLSIQFGNAPASTVGYVTQGVVLCSFLGEVETGYEFGQLALSLLEKLNAQSRKCCTLTLFSCFIQHRRQPPLPIFSTLKEAYRTGMETGDFLYAGYSIVIYAFTSLFMGVNLDTLVLEFPTYSPVLAQVKQDSAHIYLDMMQQTVEQLRETVSQPDRLIGKVYDETVMLPKHQKDNDLTGIAFVYIYKLLLAYSYGNYGNALDYITQIQPYLMALSGLIHIPIFHFYTALTHLAIITTQPESEQSKILMEVETHQTTLHQWAQSAPMNHLHKWHLVEAEKCRVCGKKLAAIEHYDRAIALAKDNQILNDEALANELAAKFYLAWGKPKIAQIYMIDAYYCYARWGAKAKIIDLESRYPLLMLTILHKQQVSLNPTETIISTSFETFDNSSFNQASISNSLDLSSILQVSQSLSSEIELEKLLSTLLDVILKNAGADKCALLMPKGNAWFIEALCQLGQPTIVLRSLPFEDHQTVPVSLINQVKNTHFLAVIENAATEKTLAADPYILQYSPKSLLCAPILNQGKLIGILYLENNLTVGAFTRDRREILHLLISQTAISLENARLYAQLEDRVKERTQELNKKNEQLQTTLKELHRTQTQMVQSEKMSALGQLVAGIAHEINNPITFIHGNLNYIHQYTQDLLQILNAYQFHYPHPPQSLQAEIDNIEFNFLKDDLPNILKSMNMGSERIRQMVLSLRSFSRLDESEYKAVNLHEGIDNTLIMLQYRLQAQPERPAINIIKEYGELPLVECYAREINQVFINLIVNAIDALEQSNQDRSLPEITANPNQILIRTTKTDQNQVKIIIADNGIGIPEQIQSRLFDPFFTTKPVGKGTGLGLSISHQVITEKHGGSIHLNSVLGQGTEFIVTLPIKAD